MKIKSALLTQASGSIGGMTASRNRGGMYMRARAIPVNPSTARQGEARANMATATGLWTNTLTDTQRQAWTSYASNTPLTDRLGDQYIPSGQQMFVKCTLPRLIAGRPHVAAGPITAGLATAPTNFGSLGITQSAGIAGSVTVEGSGTTGRLNVYMSEPTPLSRTVAHAKRAFAGVTAVPAANVFTVAIAAEDMPFSPVEGLGVRLYLVFLDDDGRVSSEISHDVVITGGG